MAGPTHKSKYSEGERINDSFILVKNYRRELRPSRYEWRWECKCDCGKIFTERERNISKRIGCISCTHSKERLKRSLTKFGITNLTAKKRIFKDYKIGAKKRNLTFELTFDEFLKLMESDCFYCGAKPEVHKGEKIYFHKIAEPWRHNGIDRYDTTKGYTIDNCVPCCSKCNYAKHDMTVEDFTKWIKNIYKHIFIEGSTTIPKGSTPKQVEMEDSTNKVDEDIVSTSAEMQSSPKQWTGVK